MREPVAANTTSFPRPRLAARIFLRLLLAGVTLFTCVGGGPCRAAAPPATIRVGCEFEFPPYSFVDKDGQPSGFAVDLIRAVADVMGLSITTSTGTWDTVWNDLTAGRLDVLPLVAKLPEREQAVDFGLPHTETYDAFFVRTGDAPIASIDAAREKEIVVMRSDAAHHMLVARNLSKPLTLVDTIPEGLALIAGGKHDAFLCSKLIGILEIKEHTLQGLTAGAPIPDYKRTFAFAVKKENAELLEKLNQGLMIVKSNGTYARIYEHWLTPQDPWRELKEYAYPVGIGVIVVALGVGVWVMLLQIIVKKRTNELIASNRMLDKSREELEQRVEIRTAELTLLNRALQTEIADRKRTAEQREASVEFLRLVNESTGVDGLIQAALDFFQRKSECQAVAIRFKKDRDFPYHATRGFSQEFVAREKSLIHRDSKGEPVLDAQGIPILACLCGAVIRGRTDKAGSFFTPGGSFWTNSISELWETTTEQERPDPIRGRCKCEGYESVAHIILRSGDQPLGLIQLNDTRKDRFTPERIAFFETLGSHLAQALSKFTAEERLRESEERLRLFIEHAPAGLAMFDREMRYLAASRRWRSDYNLGDRPLKGLCHYALFPEISGQWREAHRRGLAGEVVRSERDRFLRADGSEQWIRWEIRPWRNPSGEVLGIVIFSEEITERIKAEEALQTSLRRFELLSYSAGELLRHTAPQEVVESLCRDVMHFLDCKAFFNFVVDEASGRLRLNAWAGIAEEEAKRIEWLDYGVAVCGCVARDRLRIVADHIQTVDDDRTDLVKSYGIRAYACHPLLGPGGKIIGTLSFGTDTRDVFDEDDLALMKAVADQVAVAMIRMHDEQALKQSRDELEQRVLERTVELRHRADQLARLTSELTLTEQRERRRLAQILHDHLQQLLVGAKLGLELVHRRVGQDQRANVERIQDMLAESIQASRSLTVELSPPILHETGLADGLAWLVRWMKEKHNFDVELEAEAIPEPIREELKILLFQSVRELLFNVLKHAGVSRARVHLGLTGDGTAIRIVVADNGSGFNPQEISAGEGFGLFSIKERLALLGGVLEIDSEPKRGSRFTLTAPLDNPFATATGGQPDQPAGQEKPHDIGIATGRPAGGGPKKLVLLVDDHPVMRHGLALLLAEEPDLEIVGEAADGIEAIEKARALLPDLILMDFSMPRMDGAAATRAILSELPEIRIIGLTMYEEVERAAAIMREAGASAFLTKNANPADILSTIHDLFRKKS